MVTEYKGIEVFYKDIGKGPALVLLHGFLESSTMWRAISPALALRNRVICIDLLGHGQTECLGYVHSMEEQAQMVKAILKHLGLRKYILIGHSMGGYVSLAFTQLFRAHVKGLCLMNSTSKADTAEKKKNRDRAIEVVKQNHKTFISMSIPLLFSEINRTRFIKEINELISEAIQLSPQGIIAALEGMKKRQDHTTTLNEPSLKKILIIGQHDPVLDAKSIKANLKQEQLKIVELDGGHMSHIENREALIEALIQFIRSCN